MDMENLIGKMEIHIEVNGKIIWYMVMDYINIMMENNMKVNLG